MTGKAQRHADRATVAAYHQARLDELIAHVAQAVDGYRDGRLDAYEVDEVLHRYHRAARELYKFCWLPGTASHLGIVAGHIEELATHSDVIDWWERTAPRRSQRPD